MRDNLPELGLSEADIDEFIRLFVEEMSKEDGPNFFNLNALFYRFEITDEEAIKFGMSEF